MKKLSLKKLNLEANDMLQRNQLKTVFGGNGGYGGGTGPWTCICEGEDVYNQSACSHEVCDVACSDNGGWTKGCFCVGSDC